MGFRPFIIVFVLCLAGCVDVGSVDFAVEKPVPIRPSSTGSSDPRGGTVYSGDPSVPRATCFQVKKGWSPLGAQGTRYSSLVAGNKPGELFAFGVILNGVEHVAAKLDLSTGAWTPLPAAGSPPLLQFGKTILTESGILYVGGVNYPSLTVALYDDFQQRWSYVKTLNLPEGVSFHPQYADFHLAAIAGSVVVNRYNSFALLEPATGRLTALPSPPLSQLAADPIFHSLVVDKEANEVYLWGGASAANFRDVGFTNTFRTGSILSLVDKTWRPMAAPPDLPALAMHGATFFDGKMYVVGGASQVYKDAMNSYRGFWSVYYGIMAYDPKTNAWSMPPGQSGTKIGRTFPAIVSGSDAFLIFGGLIGRQIDLVFNSKSFHFDESGVAVSGIEDQLVSGSQGVRTPCGLAFFGTAPNVSTSSGSLYVF